MTLLLWLARLLAWAGRTLAVASDRVYRAYYRHEARTAARASEQRAIERQKKVDAAIEDLITPKPPSAASKRVGSPINRGR